MSEIFNPRAVVGDNLGVDQAQIVHDRLALDYAESVRTVDKLLDEARHLPKDVTSDDEAVAKGGVIKKLRDVDTRLEAYREAEKQPHLRAGNAIDSFFHSLRDKLARRRKGDRSVKPGAIDVLQASIDIWQEQKLAAERARLERERLEAARIAREEQARLRKAQEQAEEAARAAARARSAETQTAKNAAADLKAEEAARIKAQAELAEEQAREAQLATLVRPADIGRVRGNDAAGAGVMLTVAREGFAEIVDRSLIDMEALRPFLTDFELQKALRGWAKSTGFLKQMPGAEIGFRNRGVTR
jgi:hypothetical protein